MSNFNPYETITIKQPVYSAQELNTNIVTGQTSVNNIDQDELNSIQWLCEKSMVDDEMINHLKSDLKLLQDENETLKTKYQNLLEKEIDRKTEVNEKLENILIMLKNLGENKNNE